MKKIDRIFFVCHMHILCVSNLILLYRSVKMQKCFLFRHAVSPGFFASFLSFSELFCSPLGW